MTRLPLALRTLAIAIALAGVVDPAVTSARRVRPTVAVIDTAPAEGAGAGLADRVARRLEDRFLIVRAAAPDTAAMVLAGDRLPAELTSISMPGFAVRPAADGPSIAIVAVSSPVRAPAQSRVPVTVSLHVANADRRMVDVALTSNGVTVDRTSREVTASDTRLVVPLTLVPSGTGMLRARVSARIAGAATRGSHAIADILVSVESRAWSVLVFDRRPSWMSTFVRRALEDDPRFLVTSRTVTSTSAATATHAAPTSLTNLESIARFDAIVAGAPEALTADDVRALEGYLRRRGGAVVLLLDATTTGGADRLRHLQPLTQVDRWAEQTSAAPVELAAHHDGQAILLSSELIWPDRLPPGATAMVVRRPDKPTSDAGPMAVIWRTAIGAGRLVVSGALDNWRYRSQSKFPFDRFWQQTIAAAADASPPPVEVRLDRSVIAPGETTRARIAVRDLVLDESMATATTAVSASLEGPAGSRPIRVWPDGAAGHLSAALTTTSPGEYQLVVEAAGQRAVTPLAVAVGAASAAEPDTDLLAAWSAAHGGIAVTEAQLETLDTALAAALRDERRDETWHPMRAPWWIAPFALLLGGEWWMRRRQGRL